MRAVTTSLNVINADPGAYASTCRECEHTLALLIGEDSLAQTVYNPLRERTGDHPSLECLAHDLITSPRTLIRRLKYEETSYQELFDEIAKSWRSGIS